MLLNQHRTDRASERSRERGVTYGLLEQTPGVAKPRDDGAKVEARSGFEQDARNLERAALRQKPQHLAFDGKLLASALAGREPGHAIAGQCDRPALLAAFDTDFCRRQREPRLAQCVAGGLRGQRRSAALGFGHERTHPGLRSSGYRGCIAVPR